MKKNLERDKKNPTNKQGCFVFSLVEFGPVILHLMSELSSFDKGGCLLYEQKPKMICI